MIEALLVWYFGMGMMVAGYGLGLELGTGSKVTFCDMTFDMLFAALGWPVVLASCHDSEEDR